MYFRFLVGWLTGLDRQHRRVQLVFFFPGHETQDTRTVHILVHSKGRQTHAHNVHHLPLQPRMKETFARTPYTSIYLYKTMQA